MDKFVVKFQPGKTQSTRPRSSDKKGGEQARSDLNSRKIKTEAAKRRSKSHQNNSFAKSKFEYIRFGMLQPVAPDFKVDNFYAHRQGEYTFFLSHNHEGKSFLIC